MLCGSALGEQNYVTAVIVFGMTALLSILGWLFYNGIVNRRQQKSCKKP